MNKRDFLHKTLPAPVTLPGLLNGYSLTAYGSKDHALAALLRETFTDTDHVSVSIQFAGGNDGLNMVIPPNVYPSYYNATANMAFPIAAFQQDLEMMQLDERRLGMNFPDIGQAAAAPLLLFGKHAEKGILGNSPDIPADIRVVNNIPFQHDFRSIYASVQEQWPCVKEPALNTIMLKTCQSLPLMGGPGGVTDTPGGTSNQPGQLLLKMWPNPYAINATIRFSTKGGHTVIQQIDTWGRVVKLLTNQEYVAGTYSIDIYNDGLSSGVYFIRLQNKFLQKVINVVKMPL